MLAEEGAARPSAEPRPMGKAYASRPQLRAAGDAATDPACALSPQHPALVAAAERWRQAKPEPRALARAIAAAATGNSSIQGLFISTLP